MCHHWLLQSLIDSIFFMPNCAKNVLEKHYSVINSLFFRKEFSGKAIFFFFVDSPTTACNILVNDGHSTSQNWKQKHSCRQISSHRLEIGDQGHCWISNNFHSSPPLRTQFLAFIMCNNQPHLRLSDNKWGGIKLELLHIFHSSS